MNYRKSKPNEDGSLDLGQVVPWMDGVVFKCPCGLRTVYVASPPHKITFSDDGLLTLDGSVGSHADPSRNKPQNWCHFWLKDGESEICDDAKCPGSELE